MKSDNLIIVHVKIDNSEGTHTHAQRKQTRARTLTHK